MLKLWDSGIKYGKVLNICLFICEKLKIWFHTKFNIFQGPPLPRSVKMKKACNGRKELPVHFVA